MISVYGNYHQRAIKSRHQQKYCIAMCTFNTLRPRQNGHHFPDDLFKHIFLNENIMISIKISLKFVCKGRINNIPSLVHTMAWHRPGDKPLSESVMFSLLAHICVRGPQWVKCSVVLNIEWPFAGEKTLLGTFYWPISQPMLVDCVYARTGPFSLLLADGYMVDIQFVKKRG